ncbi:hypothetical protein D3C81_1063900 [compost metagenome]
MDLTVLAYAIAYQAVGQCSDATANLSDQAADSRFGSRARLTAIDTPCRQVVAILGQVERFFVNRDPTVATGLKRLVMYVDGHGSGTFVAVGIANGVNKGVERIPRRYGVGVGVILGVALGIEGQVAVLPIHMAVELTVGRGGGVMPGAHANHIGAVTRGIGTHQIVVHHVAAHDVALAHADEVAMGLRDVIDDGDADAAGGPVAHRVLHPVAEGFGDGIGAVVGMGRRVRRRGQGVGV